MIRFLVFLLLIFSSFSLDVDLSLSKVQSNSKWTRVEIYAYEGTHPYSFTYTELPLGWKQVNNFVYLPKQSLLEKKKYPCRLIIRDANSEQIRMTIVFITNRKKLWVSDIVYEYNHEFSESFFTEDDFSGKPQLISYLDSFQRLNKKDLQLEKGEQIPTQAGTRTAKQSAKLVVTAGTGLQNILDNLVLDPNSVTQLTTVSDQFEETVPQSQNMTEKIQKIRQTQVKKIDSIFFRFPSPSQLDETILKADEFAIAKTIQFVITAQGLTCEQKMAYLSDFFGRIKSAIKMKSFTAAQLKIIIEGAENQIDRLKKEIDFNRQGIAKLNIEELHKHLKSELSRLEALYDQFNASDNEVQLKRTQIMSIQTKIESIKGEAEQNRQALGQKELELVQANNVVQIMQKKLLDAKTRRNAIQNEKQSLQQKITNLNVQIEKERARKEEEQLKLDHLIEKSVELEKQATSQEVTVERARGDRNRAFQEENALLKKIGELEQRTAIEKGKLAFRQLQIIENLIQALESSLPKIQQDIDSLHYSCFSLKNFQTELNKGVVIYIITGESFKKYLESAYKATVPSSLTSSISLTTSNILNQVWSTTFGAAFNSSTFINSQSFSFQNDFNCLNPSTLENGFGKILKIEKNTIEIENIEGNLTLKLGACSRIESVTPLPQVGKTMYWRGNKVGNQTVQVYTASCL